LKYAALPQKKTFLCYKIVIRIIQRRKR
jgi:hypothetical protein